MRLKEILSERLALAVDVPFRNSMQKVQIYKNSPLSEFDMLLQKWGSMRGMLDDTDFYIFDANYQSHYQVAKVFGLNISDMFTWETDDEDDEGRRHIQATDSIASKFRYLDDITAFEFCCNHPTFGRIAKSGRYTFFDSHLTPD